ncbi:MULTISPECIES: hypothetical protein [Nocardioides]|uniref:hypothetical protein n=1 Tax=Nocardioides TaxID=1839 RepID=UPI000C76EC99|nr:MULTISPECIES: hypothetical protein [Nocardioides]
MYFDNKPCQVCGSEVRLRGHRPDDDLESEPRAEPDATVDDRICSNDDCPTNQGGPDAPTP